MSCRTSSVSMRVDPDLSSQSHYPEHSWIVLNQSQTPTFQNMLENLADSIGPCLLITGTPFPSRSPAMRIVKAPPYNRQTVATRILSWGRFLCFALTKLGRISGRPFLLVTTNPPLLPHLAVALNRVRGWPFGTLIWDIYPAHLVHSGLFGERNAIVYAWRLANRAVLLRASLSVTLSERMADTVARWAPECAQKICVVPNFADTRVIKPLEKHENPFVAEHHLTDRVVVLYSGNIGATHGLAGIIETAILMRENSQLKFVIIGDGLEKPSLVARAREAKLENVLFLPLQPENSLRYSLPAGDIAIVAQALGTDHLSLPSKIYSLMSAGCAILAVTNEQSDLAQLVKRNSIGEVCGNSPREIAAAIDRLTSDSQELRAVKMRARETAMAEYDISVIQNKWMALLRPLIRKMTTGDRL